MIFIRKMKIMMLMKRMTMMMAMIMTMTMMTMTMNDEDEATQCTHLYSKCCVKQLQSQLALVATNTFLCDDEYDHDDASNA